MTKHDWIRKAPQGLERLEDCPCLYCTGRIDRNAWLEMLQEADTEHKLFRAKGEDSFRLEGICLPSANSLLRFLQDLTSGAFGEIERAEGQLPCPSIGLRFEVDGSRFRIGQWEPDRSGTAYFSGKRIDRKRLRRRFDPLP